MTSIPITKGLKYKVKLSDGEYYPALLDIFDFDERGKPYIRKEGWAGVYFYSPNTNGDLSLRFRTFEMDYFKHLNFKNINEESPRVFMEEGLVKLIDKGDISSIISSNIKNASEIKNSPEYFEMFDPAIEGSINVLSVFHL